MNWRLLVAKEHCNAQRVPGLIFTNCERLLTRQTVEFGPAMATAENLSPHNIVPVLTAQDKAAEDRESRDQTSIE
jgi:hypothetical protein